MAKYVIDCRGEKCPKPLYRVKRLVRIIDRDDIVEIIGDDEKSKGEIALAIEGMGYEILSIEDINSNTWRIVFKKG
ncbi:MAG: sulfurtransferase TusA family protein [Euryarchaeota archaeon]|nr:sulfurtransferase TusA family protein [Euryarchaeota archaeon]MCD6158565.1 sulfurtransferase TusA family protein [Euryarchaeota archaeon]RLF67501.1 MAG: sulfurtransferase TusA family protein [Thermoplasmata archaeon]